MLATIIAVVAAYLLALRFGPEWLGSVLLVPLFVIGAFGWLLSSLTYAIALGLLGFVHSFCAWVARIFTGKPKPANAYWGTITHPKPAPFWTTDTWEQRRKNIDAAVDSRSDKVGWILVWIVFGILTFVALMIWSPESYPE